MYSFCVLVCKLLRRLNRMAFRRLYSEVRTSSSDMRETCESVTITLLADFNTESALSGPDHKLSSLVP